MHSEYKTSDIVLSSFLRLSGCVLANIEKNGAKGTFVFKDVSDDLITDYDLGRSRVEPQSFNAMIKSLTTSVRRIE